jgi:hypothetical protein
MLALIAGKIACDASCRVLSRSNSQTGERVIFGDRCAMLRQIIVMFSACSGLSAQSGDLGDRTERGALFKVSSGGHTMHLFGTIHVGLPGFYPLEPRVADADRQGAHAGARDRSAPSRSATDCAPCNGTACWSPADRRLCACAASWRRWLDRLMKGGIDPPAP